MQARTLTYSGETRTLWFSDISSTTIRDPDPNLYEGVFKYMLNMADGIVLLYDVTNRESFERVTMDAYRYLWMCRSSASSGGFAYPAGKQRFGCILVGNKADLLKEDPGKRQVSKATAEQWAQSQGFRHYEVTTNDRKLLEDAVEGLVKSINLMKKRDKSDLEAPTDAENGKETRLVKALKGLSLSHSQSGYPGL